MNLPRILSLSTGAPEACYPQKQICDAFVEMQQVSDRRARAIHAIFDRAGVGFRHFVVQDSYFSSRTTQERNDFYMEQSIPLAEKTIAQTLDAAGYTPQDVDDLIVVSCTGLNIPGLDLHLAGRLKMRTNLRRTCVLGMGCYAAFPAINRAFDTIRANPEGLSLVVTVELCSLHMQTDVSAENIVSSALFADGAAAVLIGDSDKPGLAFPSIVGAATACDYANLDHMAFTVTDHGFRMYLSSYVPDILRSQIKAFVDQLLNQHGLTCEQVRFWGVHPGSSKIVDYVQDQLGLSDSQVQASHQILYEYGNMSSATILFVLERIQQCQNPQPGDYGVLLAFGPGLTIEGMIVRW